MRQPYLPETGLSHSQHIFENGEGKQAAANDQDALQEIERAYAAVRRQIAHDLAGLSVYREMVFFSGVGDVKHIDRKKNVFRVQLCVESAAGIGHGPIAGCCLGVDEIVGSGLHPF